MKGKGENRSEWKGKRSDKDRREREEIRRERKEWIEGKERR